MECKKKIDRYLHTILPLSSVPFSGFPFTLSQMLMPWGTEQGAILKVHYTLQVTVVATGHNGKEDCQSKKG